jgi:hypothetical protein
MKVNYRQVLDSHVPVVLLVPRGQFLQQVLHQQLLDYGIDYGIVMVLGRARDRPAELMSQLGVAGSPA